MCGISAIYGFDSDKDNRKNILIKMLSVVKHRGPDGLGYYLSPDIALGQNRLTIVDLKTGDQPMVTKENVISFESDISPGWGNALDSSKNKIVNNNVVTV
jgi:asparagine synthase (glutamine-hydrolysing)